jgi:hypothetical protein
MSKIYKSKREPALTLRRAVKEAVVSLPGGFVSAAANLGMKSPQDLRNRLSESNKDTHHINLHHLEEIIDLTGDERIAHSVVALFNGVFLPMPKFADLPDDGALLDDMLKVMESVGAYGRELRASLADGEIKPDEWQKLSIKVQEIFTAVHLVQARAGFFRVDD